MYATAIMTSHMSMRLTQLENKTYTLIFVRLRLIKLTVIVSVNWVLLAQFSLLSLPSHLYRFFFPSDSLVSYSYICPFLFLPLSIRWVVTICHTSTIKWKDWLKSVVCNIHIMCLDLGIKLHQHWDEMVSIYRLRAAGKHSCYPSALIKSMKLYILLMDKAYNEMITLSEARIHIL